MSMVPAQRAVRVALAFQPYSNGGVIAPPGFTLAELVVKEIKEAVLEVVEECAQIAEESPGDPECGIRIAALIRERGQ